LVGDTRLEARPLQPIAFSGDLALRAAGVAAPCDDFNVMVRRGAMRVRVQVMDGGLVAGGMVAVFALAPVQAGFVQAARFDLILTDQPIEFQGQAIVVVLEDA
jgi:uncharacterized protein